MLSSAGLLRSSCGGLLQFGVNDSGGLLRTSSRGLLKVGVGGSVGACVEAFSSSGMALEDDEGACVYLG